MSTVIGYNHKVYYITPRRRKRRSLLVG